MGSAHKQTVINIQRPVDIICKRGLRIGYSTNDRTAKRIKAKTEISVERREARTTDAQTAAFIDRTEVSRVGTSP